MAHLEFDKFIGFTDNNPHGDYITGARRVVMSKMTAEQADRYIRLTEMRSNTYKDMNDEDMLEFLHDRVSDSVEKYKETLDKGVDTTVENAVKDFYTGALSAFLA